MGMFVKHGRHILWLLVLFSLVFMLIDFLIEPLCVENVMFYIITNSILLFRLFGRTLLITIIHVLMFVIILLFMPFLKWSLVEYFHVALIMGLFLLVFISSLHMMLFRPGSTIDQKAYRSGIHATIALPFVVFMFWICCFVFKDVWKKCLVQCLYFLCFLLVLLTPHFQSPTQAEIAAYREWMLRQRGELDPNKRKY